MPGARTLHHLAEDDVLAVEPVRDGLPWRGCCYYYYYHHVYYNYYRILTSSMFITNLHMCVYVDIYIYIYIYMCGMDDFASARARE